MSHRFTIWAVTALTAVLFCMSEVPCAMAQDAKAIAEAAKAQGVDVTTREVQAALKARSGKAGQGQTGNDQPEEPQPAVPTEGPKAPAAGQGPSSTELLLSGRSPSDVSRVLRQFGYDVFESPVSTFAPVTNVPVGLDYVVGPGDSFTVTMWGRQNDRTTVEVDRDGKIALPEVGVLTVSGLAFGKLQDYLDSELKRKFTDFKMHIAMGRLRTITVYVIGEARAPGTRTVSSLSTVINALFAAGGPSKNGSLRTIRLMRAGQSPQTLDLYSFLMGGDKGQDVRLADGDTLYIPLIGPVVGVAGNVKRPAIYEMNGRTTLKQVLDLAGGVTYAGWLQRIQVERVEDHARRIVVDLDLSQLANDEQPTTNNSPLATLVKDGDLVKVLRVTDMEQNVAYLEGHVVRPGMVELKPGMRLADLLDANTFLPQVNMEYGEIVRLVPPDFHPVVVPFSLARVLEGDTSQNIELTRFDRIRLFRWDEKGKRGVSVSGLVYEPNEYRFVPGMRVKDLVDAAGGLMKNSYMEKAEVTRRHISQQGVTTEKIEINLAGALAGDPGDNIELADYDHLVVRPIPELDFDKAVEIAGEVRFPGTYPIRRGERLSSIIERAGGFTDKAYLKGAIFTRESARSVQQTRMEDLTRQLEQSMLTGASQSAALDAEEAQMAKTTLEAKKELVSKLKIAKVDGRVVIHLVPLDEFRGSRYDLELEKGDRLVVPETPGIVTVVGDVFNPTAMLYDSGKPVSYYLGRVGGPTKEADSKQISVIRADGSVMSMAQGSYQRIAWDKENHQWYTGGFLNVPLDPGDTIVVPRKLDRVSWMKETKDITQIIFQIAVAAGVVLAI